VRIGSLFAGIGGFDLAARWMGWETAWFSEIDPYASAVLAQHWPGVPNHGDITTIDFRAVEPVDLLCGGFPCQDISSAGKKAGIAGERSGLWSHFARAIRELRPEWVVIENVRPLLRRGFDVVRSDLRAAGYRVARPVLMSAAALGAPIDREGRTRFWVVAHADEGRFRGPRVSREAERSALGGITGSRGALARVSRPAPDYCQGQSSIPRVADGIPHRMDRIAAIGNAIYPECAYAIFAAIEAQAERMRLAA
jgi:DNA (cytosine-5)-methyltransferase 1